MGFGLWQKYKKGMSETRIDKTLIKGKYVMDGTRRTESQTKHFSFQHLF